MTGVSVRAVVERRGVDVEFDVAPGEVMAVLGPNGAGKSTSLHVIAGLVVPDAGVVRVGDRVLTDVAAHVQVPTHARRVGLLLQDPLLFPHLDVARNVEFGPRSRHRMARRAARAAAVRWLAEVGADLAGRMPRELSGGQAQRVALARALAADPDVLLLDEPVAGLDVSAAASMRAVLRAVLNRDGRSAILITHEVLDVVTLADRVIVVDDGKIVERGSAATFLASPTSRFGARFAELNLVGGIVDDGGALRAPTGTRWHGRSADALASGDHAVAVFSPAAVAIYRELPQGSPRNAVAVTIAELDGRGPNIRVRADVQSDGTPGLAADVTAQSVAELRLAPGDRVYFAIKAQEVALHPVQ